MSATTARSIQSGLPSEGIIGVSEWTFVGAAQAMPLVLEAYRSGEGVAWSDYGHDVIEAQYAINRPPENVAESFTAPGDEIERLMYGTASSSASRTASPTGRRSRRGRSCGRLRSSRWGSSQGSPE